jgi:hypothetical protein
MRPTWQPERDSRRNPPAPGSETRDGNDDGTGYRSGFASLEDAIRELAAWRLED